MERSEQSRPVSRTRDEREYEKLLNLYLGPTVALILILLCLRKKVSMETASQFADAYKPNNEELDMIIPPMARLLDRAKLPDQVKTTMLNSGDGWGLILGVSAYLMRTGNALKTLTEGAHHEYRGNAQTEPAASSGNGVYTGLAGFGQYAP